MATKTILLKLDNTFIYLSPSLKVGYSNTNLPKEQFKFKPEKDIFFEVELVSFDKDNCSLTIKVINYSMSNADQFKEQQPKFPINYLIFEKMDWRKFSPLVYTYVLRKLRNNFFNAEEPYLKNLSADEENTILNNRIFGKYFRQTDSNLIAPQRKEPTYETKQITIKIKFEDSKFYDGYLSFTAKLKGYGVVKEFSIHNPDLKQEFENIKPWFVKKIGKLFNTTFTLTFKDHILENVTASSDDIQGINQNLVDNIKTSRVIALTKVDKRTSKNKIIYDSEDVFDILNDNIGNSGIFNSSDQNIIEILIANGLAKNVKQLQYLSKEKHSITEKIRFTTKPYFGFLFKIDENKNQYFVWELLSSHATYIWETSADVFYFFSIIKEQISLIIKNGREEYKRYYKSLEDRNFNFHAIDHENMDLTDEERLELWKDKLNSVLSVL